MIKTRPISSFIKNIGCLAAATSLAVTASAQIDMTARERVLNYIVKTSPPIRNTAATEDLSIIAAPLDIRAEGDIRVEDDIRVEGLEDEIISNEVISTAPPLSRPSKGAAITPPPPQDILTDQERENSIVRDLSQLERVEVGNGPKSFAFFTSAPDYLSQRGTTTGPRLTLRYDITRKNAKTAVPGRTSIVDIIIGTDYASISKSSEELVIYDFKEKRLLNVNKASNSFTNTSLYAASYRAVDTVGRMTNGGQLRKLPLGDGLTLDAFYLESALGYAAGAPPIDLTVSQTDNKITADFEGEQVFSAALNGPKLEDYRQAYSFLSLLYHSEPVHPAILAELKDVRAAPNAMTFVSFGPKIPDGEIISWTLKSKMSETAEFPLPKGAASIVEGSSVSPLDFVMTEAVAGRALGGQVMPESALTVINQQISQGDPLSAWISAQSLKDMMGGCEQLAGFCRAISKAQSQKEAHPELSSLIDALDQADRKSTRLEGLKALSPLISAPDAPSLVLRRAGLALAKTTKAQRAAAGLEAFDPEDLLSQAIARNPYDLLAYKGLAQLEAARGDFIQSWNINDTLRAFPNASDTLRGPIDKAEAQLTAVAPGFFPPVDP